ncbi:MAG: DUF3426 domain-containing protein [Iodobacter sp.]
MNDITRCPNCQTAFRVTETQLQAHKGKVRCGRCAFVFNARECIEAEPATAAVAPVAETTPLPDAASSKIADDLPADRATPVTPQPFVAKATPPAAIPAEILHKRSQPSVANETRGADIPADILPDTRPPAAKETPVADIPADISPDTRPSAAKETPVADIPADILPDTLPSAVEEMQAADLPAEIRQSPRPQPSAHQEAPIAEVAADIPLPEEAAKAPDLPEEAPLPQRPKRIVAETEAAVDFSAIGLSVNSEVADETPQPVAEPIPQGGYHPIYTEDDDLLLPAPPVSGWQWFFAIMAVILGLSLTGQMIYQQRTAISMELPWLRPKLISACQTLGCTMPLPQNAELLRSEWSELSYVPEFPSIIQLNATLRNLAQYEQALPLLEVTLTDDQERVVLKKVFKPAEYLISQEKNRRQFNAQDDLRAFLQIDLGELHSTAYSIYWFYP